MERELAPTEPTFLSFADTPLQTCELPGTAGVVVAMEDFVVEEQPAYLPAGQGDHVFAWVEKRGLTTTAAVERLCRHLGANPAECGYAGLKDKHGVTRQWLSFAGCDPSRLAGLELDGLKVLNVARHPHKLRTGHLRGNHFAIVLRGTVADALVRAQAIVSRLEVCGLPNYYGPQRFGRDGDNALQAWRIVSGARRLPRGRHQRRLLASALQSQLFNEVLAHRLSRGLLSQVLEGEVLQRGPRGGLFISSDPLQDQARLDRGEVLLTGPLVGPRSVAPAAASPAAALEEEVLERYGLLAVAAFEVFGRLVRGGRRPLLVRLEDVVLDQVAPDALRLSFGLPAGSYATVVLRELCKTDRVTAE